MKKLNWGWNIVIAMAIFIGGSTVFAVYAISQDVDLVRSDYYEFSLKQNETTAAQNRAWKTSASITYDNSKDAFVIHIPEAQAGDAKGTITLYRPNNSYEDRTFQLQLSADGTMIIPAAGYSRGIWELTAEWTYAGKAYQLQATRTI